MTGVFISAPTTALRAGLRAMLAAPDVHVVGEVAAFGEAFPDDTDVVLVADEALLSDAGRLLTADTALAIVVLADTSRPALLLRELPLRGWAIVSPDATTAELHAAVAAADQGLVAVPRAFTDDLFNQRTISEEPVESLTNREGEVLGLMSQGLPNKQIASALQISEHTVKFHVSSIFGKLGVASRTEAVSRGARQGLITL